MDVSRINQNRNTNPISRRAAEAAEKGENHTMQRLNQGEVFIRVHPRHPWLKVFTTKTKGLSRIFVSHPYKSVLIRG